MLIDPGIDAKQRDQREAMKATWSSIDTEARSEHTVSRTVLCVKWDPVTLDPLILEEFSHV